MYQMGKGTRPCPLPVAGSEHGRATRPKNNHSSGRNLGMISYFKAWATQDHVTNVTAIRQKRIEALEDLDLVSFSVNTFE